MEMFLQAPVQCGRWISPNGKRSQKHEIAFENLIIFGSFPYQPKRPRNRE